MKPEQILATMSQSKASAFLTCPAKAAYHYVHELPERPTKPLAFGNAWDRTTGTYYTHKIASGGEDLAPSVVRDVLAAEWDTQAQNVEDMTPEDRGAQLDAGLATADRWCARVGPGVKPKEVQAKRAMDFSDEDGDRFSVVGIIDCVGEIGGVPAVLDDKTSARKWDAKKVLTSWQPSLYTGLLRNGDEIQTPAVFRFNVAVTTKTPAVQCFAVRVDDAAIAAVLRRLSDARRYIRTLLDAQAFPPNRSHPFCSRSFCAHWRQCEKDHGPGVAP